MEAKHLERIACPACGGAGGGPFGRAGSVWDDEAYMCPRCEGAGVIGIGAGIEEAMLESHRPGIAKTVPHVVTPAENPAEKKRKASA